MVNILKYQDFFYTIYLQSYYYRWQWCPIVRHGLRLHGRHLVLEPLQLGKSVQQRLEEGAHSLADVRDTVAALHDPSDRRRHAVVTEVVGEHVRPLLQQLDHRRQDPLQPVLDMIDFDNTLNWVTLSFPNNVNSFESLFQATKEHPTTGFFVETVLLTLIHLKDS